MNEYKEARRLYVNRKVCGLPCMKNLYHISYILACVVELEMRLIGAVKGLSNFNKVFLREIIALHFLSEVLGACLE